MANIGSSSRAPCSAYSLVSSVEDPSNSAIQSTTDDSLSSQTLVISEASTFDLCQEDDPGSGSILAVLNSLDHSHVDDAKFKLRALTQEVSDRSQNGSSHSCSAIRCDETEQQGWWWLELSSALLSLASTIAMAIILLKYQQKPLNIWPWTIQINSVLSILTTVSRTSFMVTVSSAISQLKWEHFHGRTHPLEHFEAFDSASRGPLGSVRLLWTTKARSILASLGALVTILSLAVGPFAQQILEFPTRIVGISDQRNALRIAKIYDPRAYDRLLHSDVLLPVRMQASIANSVLGSPDPLAYFCPENATKCEWRDFTTLALCGSCKELSSSNYSKSCSTLTGDELGSPLVRSCYYAIDSTLTDKAMIQMNYTWELRSNGFPSTASYSNCFLPSIFDYALHADNIPDAETLSIRNLNFSLVANNLSDASGYEPDLDVAHCQWRYCLHRYSLLRSTSGRIEQAYKEEPVSRRMFGWDYDLGQHALQLASAATGEVYKVVFLDAFEGPLEMAMKRVFRFTMRISNVGDQYVEVGDWLGQNMRVSQVTGDFTISNLADRVTAAVNAYMRTPDYNANELLTVAGQAFMQQTYIQVRGAWLMLPLFETVLSTILLVFTIVITRDRPLWKSSAVAVMVHGISEGRREAKTTGGLDSDESLIELTKKLKVTLDRDNGGRLRLMLDP